MTTKKLYLMTMTEEEDAEDIIEEMHNNPEFRKEVKKLMREFGL